MRVIAHATLICAPFTNVSAQIADVGRKLTFAGQSLYAKLTYVETIPAAERTIVESILADHFMQTTFAIDSTLLAGGDAGCCGSIFACRHVNTSKVTC